MFEVEGGVHGGVDGIFGGDGALVERETGVTDLNGETVGGSRATRLRLFGRLGRCWVDGNDGLGGRGWCGIRRGNVDIVVDGLLLEDVRL